MREKTILLAISTYTRNLWERTDITLSEQEVKKILREVGLQSIDDRRSANWEFVIALYEEAQKTTNIEDLKSALFNRLKEKKYMTEQVLLGLLKERNLTRDYYLRVLHNYMNNTISQEDRRSRRIDILNYTTEIVTYYEVTKENGIWAIDLIKKEIKRILDTFYADLGWSEHAVERAMAKRLIAKAYTLKCFAAQHIQTHNVFGAYLKAYMPNQKQDSQQGEVEFSVEDSLENVLNEMGLVDKNISETIEESDNNIQEVEVKQVEKAQMALSQVSQKYEEDTQKTGENRGLGEVVWEKEFLQHMSQMARLMGYELHKAGDRVISEEYYQVLMSEKENAKAYIWRNLAKVDRQAVLSELYNAYCHIQHISLANLEAILGNFFTMLATEGIEVEEDLEVGAVLKVHTKDALKTFVFAEPTYQEGEVEGELLYKAWKYKGKTLMPKVIKVKEEM